MTLSNLESRDMMGPNFQADIL